MGTSGLFGTIHAHLKAVGRVDGRRPRRWAGSMDAANTNSAAAGSPINKKTDGKPCDNFELDLSADQFGICMNCHHPRNEHETTKLPAGPKARKRKAEPVEEAATRTMVPIGAIKPAVA